MIDESLYSAVAVPHGRVSPCFMTGKQCPCAEVIDRTIEERLREGRACAFCVLPFRPYVLAFTDICLTPYLKHNYANAEDELDLVRADQISRMGYIMCEKIANAALLSSTGYTQGREAQRDSIHRWTLAHLHWKRVIYFPTGDLRPPKRVLATGGPAS
jgi:hypothetical protein